MRIRSSSLSDTGLVRERNEDSVLVDESKRLVIVCDGMGGLAKGDVASAMAVETFAAFLGTSWEHLVERCSPVGASLPRPTARLIGVTRLVNLRICEAAHDDRHLLGMGTTAVAMQFAGEGLVSIVHVGDSRAYRLRQGRLEQLTADHTRINESLRVGEITEEQARTSREKNRLSRALGTDPMVKIDARADSALAGDVYLLCSDGLSSVVDDDTIAKLASEHVFDLPAMARALVAEARERGAPDNVTIAVASVDDGPVAPVSAATTATVRTDASDLKTVAGVLARTFPSKACRRRRFVAAVASVLAAVLVCLLVAGFATGRIGSLRPKTGRLAVELVPEDLRGQLFIDGEPQSGAGPVILKRSMSHQVVISVLGYLPDTHNIELVDSVFVLVSRPLPEVTVEASFSDPRPGMRAEIEVRGAGGETRQLVLDDVQYSGNIPLPAGSYELLVRYAGEVRRIERALKVGDKVLVVPDVGFLDVYGRPGSGGMP